MDLLIPMTMGAVIGYVTNWLAVKMIFRPRHEWRVFGLRVPFTPGVFARRRRDFAKEVAALVQNRLLSGDGLFEAVYRSFADGSADRVLSRYPVLKVALGVYFSGLTRDQFLSDCHRAADEARDAQLASTMISAAIDVMAVSEIEDMVISVINRELQAVIWLGVPLGAAIGAVQALLR